MPMITAMSSKGQIVLPKKIRSSLDLESGCHFLIFTCEDQILLKPIKEPEAMEFKKLITKAKAWAAKNKITPDDVNNAIKKVRNKK